MADPGPGRRPSPNLPVHASTRHSTQYLCFLVQDRYRINPARFLCHYLSVLTYSSMIDRHYLLFYNRTVSFGSMHPTHDNDGIHNVYLRLYLSSKPVTLPGSGEQRTELGRRIFSRFISFPTSYLHNLFGPAPACSGWVGRP